MTVRFTRRLAIGGGFAILATACESGKLALTMWFEVPRKAQAALHTAIEAFARSHRFKLSGTGGETSQYWPFWSLAGDDIDIAFGPNDEEPAEIDVAVPEGPLIYAARFFDQTELGSARLQQVVAAFGRAIGSVEGIRKLTEEQVQ